MTKSDLRQGLEQIALMYNSHNQPNFYQFVLDHGIELQGQKLPNGIDRRTPKECFKNATHLALETGLTYVEGFVWRFLPIHHAWCVDDENNVIDPTITDPQECTYLGVAYDIDFVMDFITNAETYSIMFNSGSIELLKLDPSKFLIPNWQ